MKGDFSSLRFDPRYNYQAVLHQQGRVTLDADLTAAELIDLTWRTRTARDVIGAGVAAVPVADVDGFRIETARVVGADVVLGVHPGRVWADGVLVYLPEDPGNPTAPVERTASYFPPPINPTGTSTASIGDQVRDAVVLEVVLEEINAFQEPDRLIEAALGGPDTAERINARYRFGLVRLAAGEDCTTIAPRLADPPAGLGHLSVSLAPPQFVGGDCPTVAGGGYTGFEHNLYRVEIADVTSGAPRFKWSQFNGGLVGRGVFVAGAPDTVTITANRTAIVTSGITDFYLEALQYDSSRGCWSVVYGTTATLNSDFDLELDDPPVFGTFSFGVDSVFFRLWNGIAFVDDYTNAGTPVELRDGIRLVFDPSASATYRAGDYWTFPVRAGEIANEEVLVDDKPPQGPRYHSVPLAEIDWTAAKDTTQGGLIEDCRRRFRPLTNQRVCCSILVGDGVSTFGDFDSLEEAAMHLPASGGELCLLPGVHYANLVLHNRFDVQIKGCPHRTVVLPHSQTADQPIIGILDCVGIKVSGLDLVSFFGPAIVADGTDPGDLKELEITECRVVARRVAVRVNHGTDIVIARNRLRLLDTTDGHAVVQLRATGALVERNVIGVWPAELAPGGGTNGGDGPTLVPTDPCAEPTTTYGNIGYVLTYVDLVWVGQVMLPPAQPYQAWGGIHLLGGCEDIRVLENHIEGGSGNGVTLGGVLPGDDATTPPGDPAPAAPTVALLDDHFVAYLFDGSGAHVSGVDVNLMSGTSVAAHAQSDANGQLAMSVPAGTYTVVLGAGYAVVSMSVVDTAVTRAFVFVIKTVPVTISEDQAFLYRITIEENDIQLMARSGIGFRRFSDTPSAVAPPDLSDPEAAATMLASLFAPRELVGTCNVVRDLAIAGNRIHSNLRAVFDDALRLSTRTVGEGGISLGLVESTLIAENEVLDNGVSAVNPVCGIFVGYGEDVVIRDNRIAGNGPLTDDYETEKEEGLRGGVFVRLASALLIGGEADAGQKPALRVTGNYIDQPAGRAVTAFAFGPVACVNNYLNSEHTGRWSLYDVLVGGVLILNVGGIQRQTRIATTNVIQSKAAGAGTIAGASAGSPMMVEGFAIGTAQAADVLLPGGEVLYNSNQLRLGPAHRSALATLVVTLDDLGFDGNQSTVLRPDLLLSNALCLAFSLRATDNRFRERTRQCFFSLVSVAFGLSAAARLVAMNTTAHNQGDHCIIALSNVTTGGLPVIDDNNLEVTRNLCAKLKENPATARIALLQALYTVLLSQSGGTLDATMVNPISQKATAYAAQSVQGLSSQYRYAQSVEAARLSKQLGSDDPRVVQMQARLERTDAGLQQLGVETQLASIVEAPVPDNGAMVDGRVTDPAAQGRGALTVELTRRDGTSLGVTATTDATGYYSMPLDAAQAKSLAGERAVYVQVKAANGTVLQRSDAPIEIAADAAVHAPVILPIKPVPQADLVRGTVVFREPSSSQGGPPGGDGPPTTSTPLENIKGIGPKTANRLRAAGIADIESLLRTPTAKLVEIAGFDAHAVRRVAERIMPRVASEARPAKRRATKQRGAGARSGARKRPKGK
jgi:hypothetical protein